MLRAIDSSSYPYQPDEKFAGEKHLADGEELLIKATHETFTVDSSVEMLTFSPKVVRKQEDKRKII